MFAVPNGLPPELAALTEPMAVGWHAVRRGEIEQARRRDRDRLRPGRPGRHLHAQGAGRAHGHRERLLARPPRAGDARAAPTSSSTRARSRPTPRPRDHGHLTTVPAALELAVGDDGEAAPRCRCPGSTSGARRRRSARKPKRPVIFECVGVPGMHRRHHRQRAAVLARRRGRRLHGRRPDPAGDGDQQGDRPALRASATRRSSSATRCTCSPRARSTPRRSSPGPSGSPGVEARVRRARRPRDARQDPDRPAAAARPSRSPGRGRDRPDGRDRRRRPRLQLAPRHLYASDLGARRRVPLPGLPQGVLAARRPPLAARPRAIHERRRRRCSAGRSSTRARPTSASTTTSRSTGSTREARRRCGSGKDLRGRGPAGWRCSAGSGRRGTARSRRWTG